jgi:hypothetical protein
MDKGYDTKALPLALGGRLFPRIPPEFKRLYRRRSAVEREFGSLNRDRPLAAFRVRGQERVALHADLTILVRLAQALNGARTIALAA